ncbi:alanine racemase [Paracoccus sp. (in: a-proteobacteria)]|uniref:alanine racemase n=1 Tax=Paracoccus sp. TaxID=267 RepID=UPI0035AFEDDC
MQSDQIFHVSRRWRFNQAALAYQRRDGGRPVLVGIDREALALNAGIIRDRLGTRGLCAVLKGDAYGHGVDLVAPCLVDQCTHMAAVDNRELGVLRKLVPDTPLIRLRVGADDEIDQAACAGWRIREMAASREKLKQIARIHEHFGACAQIHLSLDAAGLGRNGFFFRGLDDIEMLARDIMEIPNVEIASIACHLPDAGGANPFDRDDPSRIAIERFRAAVSVLLGHMRERGCKLPELSAYSSASSCAIGESESLRDFGCAVFDRIGSSLLGLTGCNRHGERRTFQVMHVSTAVCDVVHRQVGETVGYERSYEVQEPAGEEVALLGAGWLTLSRYQQGIGKTEQPAWCIGPDGSPHWFLGRQSMNISTITAKSARGGTLSTGDMCFLATDFHGGEHAPTIPRIAEWMGGVQHEFVTSTLGAGPSSARFLF